MLSGKTNIIEAIFVCSLGKSFRTNKEKELINMNVGAHICAQIEIFAEKEDREIKIKYEQNDKKIFYINNIKINKLSDILGNIYTVLFTPEDIGILKNEPSKRRRFLNIIISQLRPAYIHSLNQYNKVLEQRNSYLKQIKFEGKSSEILDVWDEQLNNLGIKVFNYRKEFAEKINNKIKKIHLNSTSHQENIELIYKSKIKENYLEELKKSRKIDIQKGYTNIGIHRDDIEIYINNQDVGIFGSQRTKKNKYYFFKISRSRSYI